MSRIAALLLLCVSFLAPNPCKAQSIFGPTQPPFSDFARRLEVSAGTGVILHAVRYGEPSPANLEEMGIYGGGVYHVLFAPTGRPSLDATVTTVRGFENGGWGTFVGLAYPFYGNGR